MKHHEYLINQEIPSKTKQNIKKIESTKTS